MSILTYNDKEKVWRSHQMEFPNIAIEPSPEDYHYLVAQRGLVMRLFGEASPGDEPLGELYSISGEKLSEIPPFIVPFYRGPKETYQSRIDRVVGLRDCSVICVVISSAIHASRVEFDLETREFKYIDANVR